MLVLSRAVLAKIMDKAKFTELDGVILSNAPTRDLVDNEILSVISKVSTEEVHTL